MSKSRETYLEFLAVVVKWRKFIFKVGFTVCFIVAAFSLIMPKTFDSTATVIPASSASDNLGLGAFLRDIPFANSVLGGISDEANMYLAILNSRTMMETVIEKFDLIARFNAKDMEKAVKTLRNKCGFNYNEDGTISITAEASTEFLPSEDDEDEARQLATDMANFFVSELDRRNIQLRVEKAAGNRVFIENRYQQNVRELREAEVALNQFQNQHGAIDLPTQVREGLSAAARMRAEMIAKEIEASSMERVFSSQHNSVLRAQTELAELRKKYRELQSGETNGAGKDGLANDVFLPIADLPDLGLQYARLYRDVLIQEKLQEFLLPQYEQAKIMEAKETPTLQVLDHAVPPVLRSSPKRTILVLFWGAVTLFVTLIGIFVVEHFRKLQRESPDQFARLQSMYEQVRADLPFSHKKRS